VSVSPATPIANKIESTGRGLLTSGASAGQFGDWTELIAATSARAIGIVVDLSEPSAAELYWVQIGKGPAGSEAILIPALWYSAHNAYDRNKVYRFKLNIPAGTRISARCGCNTASATLYICCYLEEM